MRFRFRHCWCGFRGMRPCQSSIRRWTVYGCVDRSWAARYQPLDPYSSWLFSNNGQPQNGLVLRNPRKMLGSPIARSPGRVDGFLVGPVRLTAFSTCAAKPKIMMAGRRWAARVGAGAMFFPISNGPKLGKARIKPGCAENRGRFRFKTQD